MEKDLVDESLEGEYYLRRGNKRCCGLVNGTQYLLKTGRLVGDGAGVYPMNRSS